MTQLSSIKKLSIGTVGAVVGGFLVGLPLISNQAIAQTRSFVNPCPRIYYEEPYNSTRLVPSGCQANAFTQNANAAGSTMQNVPANTTGSTNSQINRIGPSTTILPGTASTNSQINTAPTQPPLPETLQNAIATVTPINGSVDVMLRNNTNTVITYEVIGHTQPRSLPGGAEVMLQGLPVPVTITTLRPDRGLVQITPIVGAQAGSIGFALNGSARLNNAQEAIRIQNNGQVFVN